MTTTEEKTKPVTDLFEQALKSYEQALKIGMKMQEDSVKCVSNLVGQVNAPQDWQRGMKTMVEDFVPQTQKNVDDGLKLIEQTGRTSVELLKKAVAAAQPASAQDAQAKLLGLWEDSLNSMRDTVVAVTQSNHKAIESWLSMAKKNAVAKPVGARA